jgi:hypothetical protein
MAAPNPLVMFLYNESDYGWSERHWIVPGQPLASIAATVQGLVSNRIAFLSSDCFVSHVRVGTANPRQPITIDFPVATSQGLLSDTSAVDFAGALVLFKQGGVTFNRVFARGLPGTCLFEDTLRPTPEYLAGFTVFSNGYLADGNLTMRQLANPNQPKIQIANLTSISPRGYQFTCPTGSFPKGSLIRVSGARTFGYNGTKTVVNLTTVGSVDTVQVGGASPPSPTDSSGSVFAKLITFNSAAPDAVTLDKVTRRGAGRPFGLRRGRAQTRISLRQ